MSARECCDVFAHNIPSNHSHYSNYVLTDFDARHSSSHERLLCKTIQLTWAEWNSIHARYWFVERVRFPRESLRCVSITVVATARRNCISFCLPVQLAIGSWGIIINARINNCASAIDFTRGWVSSVYYCVHIRAEERVRVQLILHILNANSGFTKIVFDFGGRIWGARTVRASRDAKSHASAWNRNGEDKKKTENTQSHRHRFFCMRFLSLSRIDWLVCKLARDMWTSLIQCHPSMNDCLRAFFTLVRLKLFTHNLVHKRRAFVKEGRTSEQKKTRGTRENPLSTDGCAVCSALLEWFPAQIEMNWLNCFLFWMRFFPSARSLVSAAHPMQYFWRTGEHCAREHIRS